MMTITVGIIFKLIICAFAVVGMIGVALVAAIVSFFLLIYAIS